MRDLAPPLRAVRAVIFDTDGVITDSARLHATAWKATFDAYLREHPPRLPAHWRPFDISTDYPLYVDGKSRREGTTAFLESRGIKPISETVEALAAAKDRRYTERLRSGNPVPAYPGTVDLLHALLEADVLVAAVSASRHARELLVEAHVMSLFDTVVDGSEADRLGLRGKPAPDLFLEAAHRLRTVPAQAVVVEDALAGVEAGERGGFGLVVGVDRTAGRNRTDELLSHGADLVVADLCELLMEGAAP
ncbi:HAD family hydrolase [Streptomyces longispororuber]|uniref:HAD family hydrolase n=1 Tax=Streptomyces longispororuber TaxID=68230 RepID=UPI00210C8752|nr:HAD-IA family hydrolase [Streptomyces longispororuber]MCQ4205660.1 HAD-IA family hydrolase [Streptomyces longispororuber]